MRFHEKRDAVGAVKIEGDRAIVPGLANVHSHSFQRAIRGRTEQRTTAAEDNFWTWREAMYRAANSLTPDDVYHVARMAFLEMVLSGITTVGEFHYLHHGPGGARYENPNLLALQVVRAAQNVGLRIVLLRTAYARSGWQMPHNPLQARFITPSANEFIADTEELRRQVPDVSVGVAPHSARALPLEYLLEVASYARLNHLPLHMHVSEQPEEIEACLAEHGLRPVELLGKYGLLHELFTAVHAIHIHEEEVSLLAGAKASVCACPTTERNLGDGVVPADRLAEAGVSICFGSDSNAQIDLFEDARCLEYHLRLIRLQRAVLPAGKLADGLSAAGYRALGLAEQANDYFTLDLNDPSLAGAGPESIIFSAGRVAVRDVFVDGKQIVENGRHPQQKEIVREFNKVMQRM